MSAWYPRPPLLAALPAAGHVVIEASAGTGKTHAIEHTLVELLLAGVPVEQVLVVTFTEKAAADLRRRIRALLGRILAHSAGERPAGDPRAWWEIGPAERARLERALFDFHQASISTIHAFCQGVLTEHAFGTRRLLEQELVDGEGAFQAAFREALRHDLAPRGRPLRSELEAWLDQSGPAQLASLLQDVHRLRGEGVRPQLAAERLRALLDRLCAEIEGGALERGAAALERLRAQRAMARAAQDRLATLARLLPLLRGSLLVAHLYEFERHALGYLLGDADRLRRLQNAGGRALAPLLELLQEIARELGTRQAAAAQLFLPAVAARLRARKARRGQYDFDDMLTLLRDALQPPGGELLVRTLRARYRCALIDEFQDTDHVQWDLFARLFLAPPNRLFLIADPKQAIYGFRGADVFAYLGARRQLEGRSAALTLDESWRATAPLVEALNLLFDQDARPPHFTGEGIVYRPLGCGRPQQVALASDGSAPAPVHLFHFQDPRGRLDVRGVREALGRRIAREARALVLEGGLRVGEAGALRPLGWGDLFVLARTGFELAEIARHLRAEGIPCAFARAEGLFQTAEARDLRLVLQAVAEPGQRARRFQAWLTPFFGLELPDLIACGDPPGDHPLVRRLMRWNGLARRRAWAALFADLIEGSGLLRRELCLGEGERALTNTLHVLELLLEHALRSGCELEELLRQMSAWAREAGGPQELEQDVQRLESDAAAVQLLTMHKSKGLEAEVVFLYGGISDPRRRDVHPFHEPADPRDDTGPVVYHDPRTLQRVVHAGPMDPATAARVEAEREQEERRLIYVACTRARSRLYLASFDRHPGPGGEWVWDLPRLGGCHAHLAERLRQVVHGEACGALPNRWFSVERIGLEPAPAWPEAPLAAACAGWTPPAELLLAPALDPARYAGRRAAQAAWEVVSFTRLRQRQSEGAAAEPAADEPGDEPADGAGGERERDEPAAPGEPLEQDPLALPAGARAGSCVHQLLEELPRETFRAGDAWLDGTAWAAREDVQALAARALGRWGFASAHQPWLLETAYAALRTPLTLPGGQDLPHGLAGVREQQVELEFLFPVPAADRSPLALPAGERVEVGPGFVRGFMDLVFQVGGRTYVLDWKGSLLADYARPALRADVDAHYRAQAELYTLAVVRLLELADAADYEARFGGVLYAYPRGMNPGRPDSGVLAERPSWAEVVACEARWRAVLSAPRAGGP